MVSDFIDEKNGYLRLADDEFKRHVTKTLLLKGRLGNIWNKEKIKKGTGLRPNI